MYYTVSIDYPFFYLQYIHYILYMKCVQAWLKKTIYFQNQNVWPYARDQVDPQPGGQVRHQAHLGQAQPGGHEGKQGLM